jgi:membrane protein
MTTLKQYCPTIYKHVHPVAQFLRLLLVVLAREYEEDGLKQRAMSLVYISLLSLAPLLAVSFSILKGFGVHNQIEPLLFELLTPLGEKGAEITANIIFFVENIKVGVLGFLGFLMLFYTAISLLSEIEACFNYIWRVSKPRSLYRRFTDYLSVILIGPVFLFSALGITASMGNSALVKGLIQMEPFGIVYYIIGLILPYILIVTTFSFAYVFIPNSKVRLVPALMGGLVAGLAWKSTGALFAHFVAGSAHYSAIYSGFAVVLLAMIWLYISWLILLMGSVIVFHLQYPRYLHYATRRPHLSIQCQEKLAILLMAQIGRQHIKGGEICSLKHLVDTVNVPWEAVVDILRCLQQSGLLMTLEDYSRYVLTHDTDAILLRDILQAIRAAGDQPKLISSGIEANPALQSLFEELTQHSVGFLQNRSLRDILLDENSDFEA